MKKGAFVKVIMSVELTNGQLNGNFWMARFWDECNLAWVLPQARKQSDRKDRRASDLCSRILQPRCSNKDVKLELMLQTLVVPRAARRCIFSELIYP